MRGFFCISTVALCVFGSQYAYAAPTESVIFGFHYRSTVATPSGRFISGPDGELYGASFAGGYVDGNQCSVGCGSVFKLTPPSGAQTAWTGTVLHGFMGSAGDGSNGRPSGVIARGTDGSLYGVTSDGGTAGCNCGTIYKVSPPKAGATDWTYQR